MYTLYYAPGLASLAPHFVLRELDAPHQLVLLDRSRGEHQTPDYLALNPHARIPTFKDDEHVIYEAAAICLHLADQHPQAALMPPVGSAERTDAYKWLVFLTNTLQADLWHWWRPEFYVDPDGFATYRQRMEVRIAHHLEVLDVELAGRHTFLGGAPTLPDYYLAMLARWTRNLAKPASEYPHVYAAASQINARPACQQALAVEKLSSSLF